MIEKGIMAAFTNRAKLTEMWMAELSIQDVIPKKKEEKKKQAIGSKMKDFLSED